MALNLPSFFPSATDAANGHDDADLHPNWSERVVTAVATSLAVLIVATVAVLMGMA